MRVEIDTQEKTITILHECGIDELQELVKNMKLDGYRIVPNIPTVSQPFVWPQYPYDQVSPPYTLFTT